MVPGTVPLQWLGIVCRETKEGIYSSMGQRHRRMSTLSKRYKVSSFSSRCPSPYKPQKRAHVRRRPEILYANNGMEWVERFRQR